MLKIETKLDPQRIDGAPIAGLPNEADCLIVASEWATNRSVVLDWRGHSITVDASDLKRAIDNATNHD